MISSPVISRLGALIATAALVAWSAPASAAEEILTPTDPSLRELSGIAANPSSDGFWVHQDAGKPSELTLIAGDGSVAGRVLPTGAGWEDAEDIGIGPLAAAPVGALYVADVGDASAVRSAAGEESRKEFLIARGRIPADPSVAATPEPFQGLRFRYPDGENRNSEAMIVDPATGDCWIVNKTVEGRPAEVWFLSEKGFGTAGVVAEKAGDVPVTGVSGGASDPFGRFVVLRDAATAYLYPVPQGGIGAALAGDPVTVALPDQPQGEGITVTRAGDALVVNSEGVGQPFWRVPLPPDFLATLPAPPVDSPAAEGTRSPLPVVLGLLLGAAGVVILIYGIRNRAE
jgi:hypothetical protein